MADIAATGQKDEISPLLKADVHMVAQDMNRDIPSIEARRSTLNLILDPCVLEEDDASDSASEQEESKQNVGVTPQMAMEPSINRNESAESDDNNKLARKLFSRKISMTHSQESCEGNQSGDDESSHHLRRPHVNHPNLFDAAAAAAQQVQENVDRRIQELQERRKSMMMTQKQRDQQRVEQTTDALFGMGQKQLNVRASIIGSLNSERQRPDGMGRNFSSEELLLIMERAVESRVHDKLNFMSSFFRRGTICRLMCKSNARVVWINDWYPLKVSFGC
jgi:hypothetical protein